MFSGIIETTARVVAIREEQGKSPHRVVSVRSLRS